MPMTRASGAAGTTGDNANWAETLDGSWLTSFFRGGQVREVGAGQSLRPWIAGDVWQSDTDLLLNLRTTGFDARANPPRPAFNASGVAYALDTDLQNNRNLVFDQRCPPPPPAVAPGAPAPPPIPALRWVRTPVSRTVVEFPNIPAVVNGGTTVDGNTIGRSESPTSEAAEETPGVSRYTAEHVNINLRMGACGGAAGVQPVVPGACPGGNCP